MATTPKILVNKFSQNQANGDVTANDFEMAFDAVAHLSIISDAIADPSLVPTGPVDGDTYVVGTGSVGLWAGTDGQVVWYSSGWKGFVPPYDGMVAYFKNKTDGSKLRVYDAVRAAWVSPGAQKGIKVTGANYTVEEWVNTVFCNNTATVTLPSATLWPGREICVAKNVATGVTITVGATAGTINGAATATFSGAYGKGVYHSDGANWFIKV